MKHFAVVGIVAILATASNASAFQTVSTERWKSYTDMRSVRSLQHAGEQVWAATAGGAFSYTPSSNQFSQYTNSDGLSTNDITAVTRDSQSRLWFGTTEGFLNMFDPAKNEWKEIRGIAESDRVLKAVRTLYAHNDSLLIGTEFGVVAYLMAKEEFGDTYSNFGFVSQPKVNDIVVHQNVIWVATDSGVVSAPLSFPNLSSPLVWSRYSTGSAPGSNNVTSLAVFKNILYAGTSNGVAYVQNGSFVELAQLAGVSVIAMEPSSAGDEKLFI
ncbi:MAG TPA: two-component regulator propeller domain-containing protein, partial [Bacteroidota bacterium]